MLEKIKKNVGSWATIASGIVLAVPPAVSQIVDSVENVETHWGTGDKVALISGAALIIFGAGGRFAQAVAKILKGQDSKV